MTNETHEMDEHFKNDEMMQFKKRNEQLVDINENDQNYENGEHYEIVTMIKIQKLMNTTQIMRIMNMLKEMNMNKPYFKSCSRVMQSTTYIFR